jgi:hypothetical protein
LITSYDSCKSFSDNKNFMNASHASSRSWMNIYIGCHLRII